MFGCDFNASEKVELRLHGHDDCRNRFGNLHLQGRKQIDESKEELKITLLNHY